MNHLLFAPVATVGSPTVRCAGPAGPTWRGLAQLGLAVAMLGATATWAQPLPVTPAQRATAQQVAQAGVALTELADNAPASHTVQRGDTLWAVAGLFLRSPWRWPELWGMNLAEVRNPHRIYPGQVLTLDTSSGRALLKLAGTDTEPPTVRVSPRTRYESVSEAAIPPISLQAIEPFLADMLVVDEVAFAQAPRIVATQRERVLLSPGDRAYARTTLGPQAQDNGLSMEPGSSRLYRVFRTAKPLKDPQTGQVLGFESQFVGKARLLSPESVREAGRDGKERRLEAVPASLDILSVREEVRIGDRLLPEPPREHVAFVPRAPSEPLSGQVASVYGNAVQFAGQNQVVAINRGREQGMEEGHVLMLLKDGIRMVDRTDPARTSIGLPNERNGLMVVFRVFERLSYALVLDITDEVKVGDRFANP